METASSDIAQHMYTEKKNHTIPPGVGETIAPLLMTLLDRKKAAGKDQLLILELFLPLDGGSGNIQTQVFYEKEEADQSSSSAS